MSIPRVTTMRDVAERADVSISTVSFVVNNTKRVAPETRARVELAMVDLGFRRNVVARGLASGRTRVIALLFPNLDQRLRGTALSFVTSAATTANDRGYNLVLWPIGNDANQISELLSGGLVDGVVLMEIRLDDPRVDRLVESNIPFALIGRTRNTVGLPFVDIDFALTVENGLDYLVNLGHEHIALVVEQQDDSNMVGYGPTVRTETAYRESMITRGLHPVVVRSAENLVGGRAAAIKLLDVAPHTTAIVIMNEGAAFGLVRGLAQAGRVIPDDISLLSIATTREMGAMSDPPLSTMNAPGVELGRLGVNGLIDRLEGLSDELTQVLLACELQVGESTSRVAERT